LPCHFLLQSYLLVNNHQPPTSNSSLSLKIQHQKLKKTFNFETRTSRISENLGVLEEICEKESKGCGMDLTSEGKRTRERNKRRFKGELQ